MSRFRIAVNISPRQGILDPQGKAVADALHSLDFAEVRDVRVGRFLVMQLEAPDGAAASERVREMCEKLLANPVVEDYQIASVEES
ncbi:MAG TPA: phosphoribosylformylglycinamidine synthase subunit PurS [Gemmatimonadaceae bacterium]|nr:phosphoribosylformylglycinamidine synthase subunit PurS [Gemmatimonadaceae bacterium]